MALYLLLLLVLLGCARGLMDWRSAIYALVVIAAVQDPLRKLTPGSPGWMVLCTAPVMTVAALQMVLSQPYWWSSFRANYPGIAAAMFWLVLACVPAAVISATYGPGSWILTLLGAFSYSILLMAILVGYHLPLSIEWLRRFLGFYCLVSAVMLTGGFLQYLGWDRGSAMIGTESMGMQWIRYSGNETVDLIAGFYRSPDVMGWHAAATAMLAIGLALTTQGSARWRWVVIAAFAAAALLLCGRRKMVFMIPAFLLIITWLYWTLGRRQGLASLAGVVLFPMFSVIVIGDWLDNDSAQIRYYLNNAVDTIDQLEKHGIDSVVTTVQQSGFFGSGLGVATPGSHHLAVARPRVWQESGPSRVMVELGVPGFIALLVLVLSLVRALWWVTRYHLQVGSPYAAYTVGLMAFFIVNIGSLTVSGQILADPFIASFIGMTIGIVLSFGRFYGWAPSPQQAQGPAAQQAGPADDRVWAPTQVDETYRPH
jgi:hypothetical protein